MINYLKGGFTEADGLSIEGLKKESWEELWREGKNRVKFGIAQSATRDGFILIGGKEVFYHLYLENFNICLFFLIKEGKRLDIFDEFNVAQKSIKRLDIRLSKAKSGFATIQEGRKIRFE